MCMCVCVTQSVWVLSWVSADPCPPPALAAVSPSDQPCWVCVMRSAACVSVCADPGRSPLSDQRGCDRHCWDGGH